MYACTVASRHVNFHKVPELHGHVHLVGLYLPIFHTIGLPLHVKGQPPLFQTGEAIKNNGLLAENVWNVVSPHIIEK